MMTTTTNAYPRYADLAGAELAGAAALESQARKEVAYREWYHGGDKRVADRSEATFFEHDPGQCAKEECG